MTPDNEPHRFSRNAEELIADLRGVPGGEPARQKLRRTQGLADVVEELTTKYQIGRSSPEDAIREHWAAIVGGANASYSHPARIERGGHCLVVIAAHSVVRNELFHHRQTIVDKIKSLPGCREINQLHLTAG